VTTTESMSVERCSFCCCLSTVHIWQTATVTTTRDWFIWCHWRL